MGGQQRWTQLFWAIFLGVLAGFAAWTLILRLYPVLLIAAAGFAVAYVFDPLLTALERRGWSRGWAVASLALAVLVVVGLVAVLLIPALVQQVSGVITQWPVYSERLQEFAGVYSQRLATYLQQRFPEFAATGYLEEQSQRAQQWLSAKLPSVLGWLTSTVLTSARTLGVVLLTLLIAFYFMLALRAFRHQFRALFGPQRAQELRLMDVEVSHMLGQYVRGMALVCLAMGTTNAVVLHVLGIVFGTQYGLLLGALAGVAYLVPYLGMLTICSAAGLLGYLTAGHSAWLAAVLSVGCILAVNQVYDTLVMPRIVGRKVGLHPLTIVLALLAGGTLFGIVGMFLATPVAAIVKIALTHWLPVVAPKPEQPAYRQPLTFDVETIMRRGWASLRSAGRKLEDVITPDHPTTPRSEDHTNEDTST